MITIKADDGETDLFLPRVDHMSTARDAAVLLWQKSNELANRIGGQVLLKGPDDLGENKHIVTWAEGPKQWADGYAVSDGAEAVEFCAFSQDSGQSIVFQDVN